MKRLNRVRALGWAAGFAVAAKLVIALARRNNVDLLFDLSDLRLVLDTVRKAEYFVHGLPNAGVNWQMPMTSVFLAFTHTHWPLAGSLAIAVAMLACYCLLAFDLGSRLHSPECGLAAAGFVALWIPSFALVESLEGLLWLLIAASWPTGARGRSWEPLLLAAILGAGLLTKSTFALVPLVAAAWVWARRRRLSEAAVVGLVPYLVLLPWIAMNRLMFHTWTLFEVGRADVNLVATGLGFIGTAEGDVRRLAGLEPGRSALSWLLAAIAAHPWRYASAVARRLAYALSFQWGLYGTAAASFFLLRRREAAAAAAILSALYLLLLCTLSTEARYFQPLHPLLAVICAAGVFEALRRSRTGSRGPSPAARAIGAVVVCVMAYASWLTLDYPIAARRRGSWERAVRGRPNEACLWSLWAWQRQVEAGDGLEAFARAARLDPGNRKTVPSYLDDYLVVSGIRSGDPGFFRSPTIRAAIGDRERLKSVEILLAAERSGRRVDDGVVFAAEAPRLVFPVKLRVARTDDDLRAEARLKRLAQEDARAAFHDQTLGYVSLWPPARQARLLSLLPKEVRVSSSDRSILAARARLEKTERPIAAERASARLSPLEQRYWSLLARAKAEARKGRRGDAVASLERALSALEASPERLPADRLLGVAEAAADLGERGVGLRALRRAQELDPPPETARQIAVLAERLRASREFFAWLLRRPPASPAEADLWLDLSAQAERDGGRELTLRLAERLAPALRRLPSADPGGRAAAVARIYLAASAPEKALAWLGEWTRKLPGDAELWREESEAAERAGRRDAALNALDRSLAVEPRADRRRAIALAFQRLGAFDKALPVLEDGARASPSDASLRADLGVCEYLAGRPARGIESLRRAIDLDPRLLTAYASLGSIYEGQGRLEEALKTYDAALALAGGSADAALRESIAGSRREAAARLSRSGR